MNFEHIDKEYIEAVKALARAYSITFEEMLERERRAFAYNTRFKVEMQTPELQKMRDDCVFFCYQDVGDDAFKYTNGETLHGYYRIVKTDQCYEFTLMETDMHHPTWQLRAKEKHVTRFPLDVEMGKGSFVNVKADKIHILEEQ